MVWLRSLLPADAPNAPPDAAAEDAADPTDEATLERNFRQMLLAHEASRTQSYAAAIAAVGASVRKGTRAPPLSESQLRAALPQPSSCAAGILHTPVRREHRRTPTRGAACCGPRRERLSFLTARREEAAPAESPRGACRPLLRKQGTCALGNAAASAASDLIRSSGGGMKPLSGAAIDAAAATAKAAVAEAAGHGARRRGATVHGRPRPAFPPLPLALAQLGEFESSAAMLDELWGGEGVFDDEAPVGRHASRGSTCALSPTDGPELRYSATAPAYLHVRAALGALLSAPTPPRPRRTTAGEASSVPPPRHTTTGEASSMLPPEETTADEASSVPSPRHTITGHPSSVLPHELYTTGEDASVCPSQHTTAAEAASFPAPLREPSMKDSSASQSRRETSIKEDSRDSRHETKDSSVSPSRRQTSSKDSRVPRPSRENSTKDSSGPPSRRQTSTKDSRVSPPRRENSTKDSNVSAPSRENSTKDSSNSPLRRENSTKDSSVSAPSRENSTKDSSNSPLRRENSTKDSSASAPSRENSTKDSGVSLPRRESSTKDSSVSPSRRETSAKDSSDSSPRRANMTEDSSASPSRRDTFTKNSSVSPSSRGTSSSVSPSRRDTPTMESRSTSSRRGTPTTGSGIPLSGRDAPTKKSSVPPPRRETRPKGSSVPPPTHSTSAEASNVPPEACCMPPPTQGTPVEASSVPAPTPGTSAEACCAPPPSHGTSAETSCVPPTPTHSTSAEASCVAPLSHGDSAEAACVPPPPYGTPGVPSCAAPSRLDLSLCHLLSMSGGGTQRSSHASTPSSRHSAVRMASRGGGEVDLNRLFDTWLDKQATTACSKEEQQGEVEPLPARFVKHGPPRTVRSWVEAEQLSKLDEVDSRRATLGLSIFDEARHSVANSCLCDVNIIAAKPQPPRPPRAGASPYGPPLIRQASTEPPRPAASPFAVRYLRRSQLLASLSPLPDLRSFSALGEASALSKEHSRTSLSASAPALQRRETGSSLEWNAQGSTRDWVSLLHSNSGQSIGSMQWSSGSRQTSP
ncbi:hypothetical protein AB1Y20_014583 [Prymnesium parvum]|uniref:Proteophosphoglycan ppg4 n=1 Tax=Prymnesium parvum TaxID=97485 RepID=A0AB34IB80_PRYPA